MAEKRTWETQDPMGDAYLIDPGVLPGERPLRKDEKAIRHALGKSTPEPLKRGEHQPTRNRKG